MKKILKLFLFIITIISMCGYFSASEKAIVKAEENQGYASCANVKDFTIEETSNYLGCSALYGSEVNRYGKVEIKRNGLINVSYKYGISEVLVYLEPEDGSQEPVIVHASGSRVSKKDIDNEKWGLTTIRTDKYFDEGTKISISLVYQLAEISDYVEENIGFFNLLSCPINSMTDCKNWETADGENMVVAKKTARNVETRIKALIAADAKKLNPKIKPNPKISYVDVRKLVFEGNKQSDNYEIVCAQNEKEEVAKVEIKTYNEFQISDVSVNVENQAFEQSKQNIEALIYDTIIPTLLWIIGIAAAVSCTVLGYQIVKSADEPQERASKVATLRNILIGLALAFILLIAAEPVVKLVENYLEK